MPDLPVRPRTVVGAIGLAVVGALMYTGTITATVGMPVILAILAGYGYRVSRENARQNQ